MSEDDRVKRVRRMSRKHIPSRRGQKITERSRDPKHIRSSAKEEILRALEEDEEEFEESGPEEVAEAGETTSQGLEE